VHSILPLAPRAKQPALHINTIHIIECPSNTVYSGLWCSPGLAAGGGERSGPNLMLRLLFSFMLGLRRGWGENFLLLNVSETATHVMGRYASQICQMRTGAFLQPCARNLLRIRYTFDFNKRTEIF
jgi:hypothetical protein